MRTARNLQYPEGVLYTEEEEEQPPFGDAKVQKSTMLDLMLGQIANYCPVIARNTIVKNSTSLEQIWQTIRLHYGFQMSGAHFLDFNDIKLRSDENPEDLYQRLLAFVDYNLLKRDGGITHQGEPVTDDEELTPTIENFVVLTWLRLIHADLPRLVKQRYGTELRSRTLASIKPEISQALNSLLEEIRSSEDTKAMRSAALNFQPPTKPRGRPSFQKRPMNKKRSCPLCKAAGRNDSHYLSECRFLPDEDRKYLAKVRQIIGIVDDISDDELSDTNESGLSPSASVPEQHSTFRVSIRQSPYIDTFQGHNHVRLTIDSGATGNMIRLSTVRRLNAKVDATKQSAKQANGSSPLNVMGETRLTFTRDGLKFHFEGLVIADLDVEVLAGIPFMESNDISIRPAKREVLVGDSYVCYYGSSGDNVDTSNAARHAHVLRATTTETVWPGDFMEFDIPQSISVKDSAFALEPYFSSPNSRSLVQPDIVHSVARKIRVPNLTNEPCVVRKHDHLCQIRSVYTQENASVSSPSTATSVKLTGTLFSSNVSLDPNQILPADVKSKFADVLKDHDTVFSPSLEGYNGSAGPFEARVNKGPVQPPQRKGRIPQYSRGQLEELQRQFNDLEREGVFRRPEDIGVTVEYLNSSFLVKKGSGGFRLVTAFSEVGRYSKPQPSLMPDVDSILRKIGQWKYVAVTDLTKAFYQIPLSKDSLKYAGVIE